MLRKQLIVSKYLLRKGEIILNEKTPVASGLAISLFQDAVETAMWVIAKEFDAEIKDNMPFVQLWDAILKAKKNVDRIPLPLKAKMLELNKARINFKHYGNLPAVAEAEKFLAYASEFLEISCESFFDIDFDKLTLIDMIRDAEIRERLLEAQACFEKEQYEDCLRLCAESNYIASAGLNKLLPNVDSNLSRISAREVHENVTQGFKYIAEYLGILRNACILSFRGASIKDHLKFKSLLPSVTQTINGKYHTFWYQSPSKDKQQVEFVLKYAIESSLDLQERFLT